MKWGDCDIGKLEDMRDRLLKVQEEEVAEFVTSCVRELAARLLALVIPRTPVGRKPRFLGKDGKDLPKTIKVKSLSGKSKRTRSFLTREGEILEKYWSGYKGGTLRRGWTGGKDARSAGAQRAYLDSVRVVKSGEFYVIEIINPVEYASYVEYGHVQTPGRYVPALGKSLKSGFVIGRYMLTKSELQLLLRKDAILQKKLDEWLTEVMMGAGK